jgi:hypothetical protein
VLFFYRVTDTTTSSMLRPTFQSIKATHGCASFEGCHSEEAQRFIAYLNTHRTRIPNDEYLHPEGFSIGSGEVESAIKQIGGRVKISDAQWDAKNVPQLLKHRCAYLNGYFSSTPHSMQ